MSTLLEQASLVLIPSGYKEDVVYSQIPTNGNGDLSFTRASNGTRINSAGLVEVCPWNLAQYSEDLSNAVWTKARVTITANDTTAPNGTTTADKVSLNSGTNSKLIQQAYNQNGAFTQTVYAKAGTHNFLQLLVGSDATPYCNFDLVNGTYSASGCTASITSVGNGWFYLTMSYSTTIGSDYYLWAVDSLSSARADVTSSTGYYYVWGFQLNIGTTAKPYFPTTDRLNVPRLTYQNGGGGCPSLLLEKQSTNNVLYSEQFDNVLWLKGGNLSVTANSIVSPDGTQNADTATNSGATAVYLYQLSSGSAVTWTASVYAKKGTNKYVGLSICAGSLTSTRYQPVFNLDDGTIQAQNISGSNVTNTSCSITSVGNGWYRITATGTLAAGSDFCYIVLQSSNNTNYQPDTTGGSLDWTNATNGNAYLWGAQLEASSYVTTLIPTTSASATRVADVCTKNGIGALIGGTSGTVFFDIKTNPTLSSANYKQFCYYFTSGGAQSYMFLDGANKIQTNSNWGSLFYNTAFQPNTRYKVALVFAPNDFALYVNGVSVATASSGTPNNNVDLQIGQFNGTEMCEFVFNQYTHFPSRLTNAELASLTTI